MPCVVVYHLPSFIDCSAWSLFRRRHAFNLQTVTWRQSVDARRLSDPSEGLRLGILPVPTLEERFEPADSAWCNAQLQELAKIRLSPFLPEGSSGLDGETFGVHIPYKADIEWWCSGPEDWRELVSWANEFIAQVAQVSRSERGEQGASPNGGAAEPSDNPDAIGGPPSVS